jgi:hypothetical protein
VDAREHVGGELHVTDREVLVDCDRVEVLLGECLEVLVVVVGSEDRLLAVTPRSDSSATIRPSSPPSISERRIWSSQTLTPASVSASSRGFTSVAVLI